MTSAAECRLHFSKMHGAGNDFVLIDRRSDGPLPGATARRMADRHLGVGCDQLITIEAARSTNAVAAYRIWNTDGSPAQQCGNGARCVAAWLRRDNPQLPARFMLDSPAGAVMVDTLAAGRFAIDLGVPDFEPARIPFAATSAALWYHLPLAGREQRFAAASMGNPHALLVLPELDDASVATLGFALQARPEFREGVNVGFAKLRGRDAIDLRVVERGVGETLACGSGACAAVAMLVRANMVGRRVHVRLPGGELDIEWPADDAPVRMAGPTAFVFEGEWPGSSLDKEASDEQ